MLFKLFLLSAIIMICTAQHQINWGQQTPKTDGQIYTLGPGANRLRNATTTKSPESETQSPSESNSLAPSPEKAEESQETQQEQSEEQQIEKPKPEPPKDVKPTTDASTAPQKATDEPTTPSVPPPPLTNTQFSKFQQDLRRFSASIYHQIVAMNEGNIFFSPLSISHAMGMVNTGAKGNSSVQLRESLRMEETESNHIIDAGFKRSTEDKFLPRYSEVITVMASRSFVNHGFSILPEYMLSLEQYYHSIAENIDFGMSQESADRINGWVEEETRGLIKDLISKETITPLTRLILVNALYFKAPWVSLFRDEPPADFTTPTGVVQVPYITNRVSCKRLEKDDFEYLAVPYKDGETFFVVIMPKTDKAMMRFEKEKNLDDFFKFLKRRVTRDWLDQKIQLHLPAFTLEKSLDVKKVLQTMGVEDIFSAYAADLSGISKEFIYVTNFMHKAKITVTKDGTEAAAATAVVSSARVIQRFEHVYVNQPFVFAIYERGNILFMGKMVNPSGK